MKKNKDKSMN